MHNLYQIAYLSEATEEMMKDKDIELPRILSKAKEFNYEHNITGILLHKDRFFVQILEGREDIVKGLYAKILQDKRHKNVTTLLQQFTDKRLFGNWSMSLKIVEPEDEKSLRLTYAWDGLILNYKNQITIQESKLNNLFDLAI